VINFVVLSRALERSADGNVNARVAVAVDNQGVRFPSVIYTSRWPAIRRCKRVVRTYIKFVRAQRKAESAFLVSVTELG